MKRRFLAVGLALSLILSMAGCKKGGETEPTEAPGKSGSDTSQTTVVDMNDPTPGEYGKLYYAPVDEAHVAGDDISMYIDNEILIVVNDGTTEEQVRKLAEKYNAKIVGAIEVSGDYQLQLDTVRSKSELEGIMQQLEAEEIVDSVSFNYLTVASEESDDPVITERNGHKFGDWWKDDLQNWGDVKGKSWGFEAINTIGAWDELNNHKEQIKPVKVGLVDGGFDASHDDLGFVEVFHNAGASTEEANHGTHVAGIIAAKTNNDIGICGVYPYGDKNLYGVSYNIDSSNGRLESVMFLKIAYAELLVRNVKVINISLGFNWSDFPDYQVKFFGSHLFTNHNSVKEMMETSANINKKAEEAKPLGDFLDRMRRKGYDFVIVTSAGNDSGFFSGHIDCRLSSWNTVIRREDYPEVFDRIIVVGAVENNMNEAVYSNGGKRVDIYAPGGTDLNGIFSTIAENKYDYLSGTSQAAPHVAGVAAMVWSANNALTGAQVKEIIVKDANKNSRCTSRKMVDAQKAVSDAFKQKGKGNAVDSQNGIVMSYVVERFHEDNKIEKAKIEFKNIETGEVVYIKDPTTGKQVLPETDGEGHFEIVLPEGKYSLSVKADGFEDYEWPDGENYENPLIVKNGQVKYLESWIKLRRPGKKEVQFSVFALEADTLKPINGKKIKLTMSNSELICKNPEQTTGKDGSVVFDIPMGEKNKTIVSNVTLHIDGYKDFILDDFVFENDSVDMLLQADAMFEKEASTSDSAFYINEDGYMVFGHYEQDNNTQNGKEPIEWEILDENSTGKLLISRYVLDAVPFNNEYATDVTWETCSLREWLNKDFLNEAFTKGEQALIPKAHLKNSGIEMPGGNDTEDQVFCLSLDEAAKYYKFTYDKYSYFGFKKELISLPTEYAKAHGLQTFNAKDCIDEPYGDEYWLDGYAPKGYQASIADLSGTYWWLRTMGWDCDACAVFPNGLAGAHYESGVSAETYGVRPVLWIGKAAIGGETNPSKENEKDPTPDLDGYINKDGYVVFGHYEQDNNTANGKEPIEWKVLAADENGLFVLAKDVLDGRCFNDRAQNITWANSSLREWLNDEFYRDAFTSDEMKGIRTTKVKTPANPKDGIAGGADVEDRVFLLSVDEAIKYLPSDQDRIAVATEYAAKNYVYLIESYGKVSQWWLRSSAEPGLDSTSRAAMVFYDGEIHDEYVHEWTLGVRPAMWIRKDAIKGAGETETEPNLPEPYDGDGVAINAENFPDERFRMLLQDDYDEDGNWVFSEKELEEIKKVDVFEENISSLQGIELLYNLQRLQCGKNKLTRLDVSHNTKLKYLACSNNPLSGLDVSHNTALEELYFSETGLKEVDISNNTNLKVLYCSENDMTSLDVSHNPALEALGCKGNQLTSLDVSKNTKLEKLYCSSNLLTELDLSHNPDLKQLHCQVNELQTLDVSRHPLLVGLECFYNQLTELDVSHNPMLTSIDCGDNQLKSLDVSHNPALTSLTCGGNQLVSLDVSRNEELKRLTCAANHISNLDLSNNKQLTYLRIDKKAGFTGLVPGVDVELVDGGKFTHMTSE